MKKQDKFQKQTAQNSSQSMVFQKENFTWIAISLAVVVVGFVLMAGTEGDIYDFRRTTLAPAVVIIGFLLGIYAIFLRKK